MSSCFPREVKNNKKRFVGYVRSKKKSKEVVGLVCGDDGVMVTADRDKAEVFNTSLLPYFLKRKKIFSREKMKQRILEKG